MSSYVFLIEFSVLICNINKVGIRQMTNDSRESTDKPESDTGDGSFATRMFSISIPFAHALEVV